MITTISVILLLLSAAVIKIYLLHRNFADTESRKKNETYRLMYENSPLAYQSLDENGCFIDVNPAWLKLFGYSRQEVIGKSFGDFLIDEQKPLFGLNFPIFKSKGEIWGVQYTMESKTGELLEIEADGKIACYPNGKFKQTHCILRDITKQKRAEAAVRESRVRMESLFLAAPVGIGLVKERVFLDINDRVCQITGYSREELVDKNTIVIYPDRQEYEMVGKVKYEQVARAGFGIVDTKWKTKNGDILDIRLSSSLLDRNDMSKGVTFTALDITDKKRAERQNVALMDQLREKKAELEQFIQAASHDLKTPLINIKGFSNELSKEFYELKSLLKDEKLKSQNQEQLVHILNDYIPQSLLFIQTGADKIENLIEGLDTLLKAGTENISPSQIDMNELIGIVIDEISFQIRNSDAQVIIEPLPPCYADKSGVNRIFSNLINNAVKYLEPSRKGMIKVSGQTNSQFCTYCVEDNGIGIDEKYYDEIFKIFRRLDCSDRSDGQGLGLNIAMTITRRNNGRIWVESVPGTGSRFFVQLPLNSFIAECES